MMSNRKQGKWRRLGLTALSAALLIVFTIVSAGASHAAAPDDRSADIERKARQWAEQIAAQPGFESWSNAVLETSPLGPGTHSWLVLVKIKSSGQVAGYLVVHAAESAENNTTGLRLGEYGLGRPPFDSATRSSALARLELDADSAGEQLYVHPLMAAWSFNGKFADANSGESLPVNETIWNKTAVETAVWKSIIDIMPASDSPAIIQEASNPSFFPYNNLAWLTEAPLSDTDVASLRKRLDSKEPLRYTAERFDQAMRYVWSVTGYHAWNDDMLYVAMETDEPGSSRRYVPLQLLNRLGSFYR